MTLVWLTSTHTLSNTVDSKTFSPSVTASREKQPELSTLLWLSAQSSRTTFINSWRAKSSMESTMVILTCHSISHTPTQTASSTPGDMSQLQRTTGFQATVSSPRDTSRVRWAPTCQLDRNTLLSRRLMDLHITTTVKSSTHWSTTSTSKRRRQTSKLSDLFTIRVASRQHEEIQKDQRRFDMRNLFKQKMKIDKHQIFVCC